MMGVIDEGLLDSASRRSMPAEYTDFRESFVYRLDL